MLLVKTKIRPSKISGIGLFADEFIPEGTPVWKFMPGFDLEISQDKLAELSEGSQSQVLNYSYFNPKTGNYVLPFDDARFFNHADEPNTTSGPNDSFIDRAARDIKKGEELTQNYKIFDGDNIRKLSMP